MRQDSSSDRKVVQSIQEQVTVRTLALSLGWPWQRVAKVLQRLAAGGEVVRVVTEHKDKRHRLRRTVWYKPVQQLHVEDLPAWLGLRVHPVRGGTYVAGRLQQEDLPA